MTDSGPTVVTVSVNGAPRRIDSRSTVADLVEVRRADGRGLAVAVDREVIPRSAWGRTTMRPGAIVEVLAAAAGG